MKKKNQLLSCDLWMTEKTVLLPFTEGECSVQQRAIMDQHFLFNVLLYKMLLIPLWCMIFTQMCLHIFLLQDLLFLNCLVICTLFAVSVSNTCLPLYYYILLPPASCKHSCLVSLLLHIFPQFPISTLYGPSAWIQFNF